MRKILLILTMVMITGAFAFSQLSSRENDATVLKLGTRPGSGDMALTFAPLSLDRGGPADLRISNQLGQGDFLTFKYYMNEGTALRIGLCLTKESTGLKGDIVDNTGDFIESVIDNENSREFTIVPGLEKHYNAANIFDVYAGADLYLGFRRYSYKYEVEEDNGDYIKYKESSNPLVVGLGGVVGFNVFIAQLPVSLGIEYGLNMKWTNAGKSKIKSDSSIGGTTTSQEYFLEDGSAIRYSKLSLSEIGINTNNNVRIVLNIYFGK